MLLFFSNTEAVRYRAALHSSVLVNQFDLFKAIFFYFTVSMMSVINKRVFPKTALRSEVQEYLHNVYTNQEVGFQY